jgi:hypothetical protein
MELSADIPARVHGAPCRALLTSSLGEKAVSMISPVFRAAR